MKEITINNLGELEKFCDEFSKILKPGNVVCLTGDLGAGKTTFVSAVTKALGINDSVQSPTFNLLLQYKNDDGLTINHFDLYRLEKEDDLDDIGFYETIEDGGITFIEWAEKFPEAMPSHAINLSITKLDSNSRKFT